MAYSQAAQATSSNYAYSSAFVPIGDLVSVTSGSVQMSVRQEGLRGPDGTFGGGGNHSLGDFVVNGTGTERPSIELTLTTGSQYCRAWADPCFMVYTWKNGAWTHEDGYVEASGGIPDNGTWHPALGSTYDIGYTLTNGRFNVTLNGSIVGWIPDSYWGQTTFGPITEEQVASEVFNSTANWTGSPLPSMDYTFSNFKDSSGNVLPSPAVGAPYTISTASTTGWTVSGGVAPSQSRTYWPVEASADNGYCLDNYNSNATNGNKIQIWQCGGDKAQSWSYNPATKAIVNVNGMCLDDTGDSSANGTKVQLWSCLGNTAQTWNPIPIGSGFVEFKNGNGKVCLDNTGDSHTDGTRVQVWSCLGDTAQRWDPDFSFGA
jgi:hypothetical protein